MKKLFCILAVILLLTALSITVLAEENVDPRVLFYDSYWTKYVVPPLSAEMKQEIEELWPDKNYPIVIADRFYYGEYNGAYVFLEALPNADMTMINVGEYVLEWNSAFNVHVYRNGEFLDLKQAYEQQWLNDEDIRHIALLADCTNHMRVGYLGLYGDCYVGFVDCPMFEYAAVETTVTIGGRDFVFPTTQQLLVCRDGKMLELEDAYAAGWMSDAIVHMVWVDYIVVYCDGADPNPNAGDIIWMPVVLLMTSGAGLCVLTFRKKRT